MIWSLCSKRGPAESHVRINSSCKLVCEAPVPFSDAGVQLIRASFVDQAEKLGVLDVYFVIQASRLGLRDAREERRGLGSTFAMELVHPACQKRIDWQEKLAKRRKSLP